MKFIHLRGDGKDFPWTDPKTGALILVKGARVHITKDGYGLIAEWALQTVQGTAHICSWIERDGVVSMNPMADCGMNGGRKRQAKAKLVKGPVRITCKKCVVNAFLDLCRRGALGG